MQDKALQFIIGISTILLVLPAGLAPSAPALFVESFCTPVLFACVGYALGRRQADRPHRALVRSFVSLYPPFVRWSLFFLVVTCFVAWLKPDFPVEGVAPAQVVQYGWNILFSFSAQGIPFCDGYWLFRAIPVGLLAFCVLHYVLRLSFPRCSDWQRGGGAFLLSLLLLAVQAALGLHVTAVAGGGYRELAALMFICAGYALATSPVAGRLPWQVVLASFLLLMVCGWLCPGRMFALPGGAGQPALPEMLPLPVTGLSAFLLALWSTQKRAHGGLVGHILGHVGRNARYVVGFHQVTLFLASSALGLRQAPGGWWVLLWALGVLAPLGWLWGYRWLERRFGFDLRWSTIFNLERIKNAGHLLLKATCATGRFLLRAIRAVGRGIRNGILSFVQGIKDIISASNPKDE